MPFCLLASPIFVGFLSVMLSTLLSIFIASVPSDGPGYWLNGEPLTVWGVSMLFKRLKKRTGIAGKRVSAHNSPEKGRNR